MTLSEARDRLRARCLVDLDSEVDLDDPAYATTALMLAAREVSRDTYFLFTERAALTLTSGIASYDLLSSSICAKAVFDVVPMSGSGVSGVRVNGAYVSYLPWAEFRESYPTYFSATSTSTFSHYTVTAPSSILFNAPANSTAVAATDNFVTGWYLHPTYTWVTNEDTELLGPAEFHDLIVMKAAINITQSYIDGEGLRRWQLYNVQYEQKAAKYKAFNTSMFKPLTRHASAGAIRRVAGLGSEF